MNNVSSVSFSGMKVMYPLKDKCFRNQFPSLQKQALKIMGFSRENNLHKLSNADIFLNCDENCNIYAIVSSKESGIPLYTNNSFIYIDNSKRQILQFKKWVLNWNETFKKFG